VETVVCKCGIHRNAIHRSIEYTASITENYELPSEMCLVRASKIRTRLLAFRQLRKLPSLMTLIENCNSVKMQVVEYAR